MPQIVLGIAFIVAMLSWIPIAPEMLQPKGVNETTFRKIKLGMTLAEVEAIMGGRAQSSWSTGAVDASGQSSSWHGKNQSISVLLVFNFLTDEGKRGSVTHASFWNATVEPPRTFELRPGGESKTATPK